MSGPTCETCGHFHPMPLSDDQSGECHDPFKIIYYKYGDRANSEPVVNNNLTCSNYTVLKQDK
ncbi:hypothetical protein LCGC14_1020790 [marine sediment metagenome]|uniref:Uncharacterized protein n=1 Tax=marine sediment metagenome TaxID=412755 RepID=A0A0F9QFK0_9ZZZZ